MNTVVFLLQRNLLTANGFAVKKIRLFQYALFLIVILLILRTQIPQIIDAGFLGLFRSGEVLQTD